ncbi:MAG: prepilin-type N-terminal cleavage/methylation domain-containing protein, partial [Flavobacteriales bacterium]|nr:prepilin-type N-terminal cleavage/methylation domain-containing protein [Flavobacteriales bacterium]
MIMNNDNGFTLIELLV